MLLVSLVRAQTIAPAPPQYLMDDGFSVPGSCCLPVTPNLLTQVPSMTIQAEWACFQDCVPAQIFPVTVLMTGFMPTSCDEANVGFVVSGAGLNLITSPTLKFSRTFLHRAEPTRQTWRYLINDVISTFTPQTTPCPFPPCIAMTANQFAVQGHLDISFAMEAPDNPNPTDPPPPDLEVWRFSLSLSHHVGCIVHSNNPMFNAHAIAPGTPARHDDRSYHLVGPTPFNFAATPPPGTAITIGNSGLDSVRSTVDAQVLCLSEAQVSGPVLGQLVEYCFCGTNPGPAIFYEQFFFPPSLNAAVCPTSGTSSPWNSIPGLTDFIGTGWVQQFIGRWTGTHPWL
ncbi:MAG: hypothetical protein KDB53_15140, partial [Planctomycetes bacterium]|nr:hypothetical protein [Planctomycetota bacterium]